MEENVSFIQRQDKFQTENEQVIKVTPTLKYDIITSTKWGKFFGILSYIFAGICFLGGLLMLLIKSSNSDLNDGYSTIFLGFYKWFMFIIMLLCTVIYAVGGYYLLKISNNLKKGIELDNQEKIANGFYYLKTFLTIFGIITIVVIGIYALSLVAGGIIGFAAMF